MTEKTHLSFGDRFKIANAIQANTEPTDDRPGFIRYINGLTDVLMAEKLTAEWGVKVTRDHVQYARQQAVGRLYAKQGDGWAAETAKTIAGLREDVEALRKEVRELRGLVDYLTSPAQQAKPKQVGTPYDRVHFATR
jgi:hypothetical protein